MKCIAIIIFLCEYNNVHMHVISKHEYRMWEIFGGGKYW